MIFKAGVIITVRCSTGAFAFAGGAAAAKLTGRSMLLGGLRQFTAAFLGTGMSFLAGHLISGHVS